MADQLEAWADSSVRAALLEAVLDRVPVPVEIGLVQACGEQFVHSNAAAKRCSEAGSAAAYTREEKFFLLPPDGTGWMSPLQVRLRFATAAVQSKSGSPSPPALQVLPQSVATLDSAKVQACPLAEPDERALCSCHESGAATVSSPSEATEAASRSPTRSLVDMLTIAAERAAQPAGCSTSRCRGSDGGSSPARGEPDSASNISHVAQADNEEAAAEAVHCVATSVDKLEKPATSPLEPETPALAPTPAPGPAKGVQMLELQQELTLYRTVIQQLPMCVVVATSPEGAVRLASSKAMEIWGSDPVSCIEQYGSWPGFHEDGKQYAATEWPLARSLLQGEHVSKELVRWRRKDGG